jgi:hypothetical protein
MRHVQIFFTTYNKTDMIINQFNNLKKDTERANQLWSGNQFDYTTIKDGAYLFSGTSPPCL